MGAVCGRGVAFAVRVSKYLVNMGCPICHSLEMVLQRPVQGTYAQSKQDLRVHQRLCTHRMRTHYTQENVV